MLIRPFKNHLPRVAARVYIDVAAVVIGDVTLGADSSVWPCAVIRGDVNSISIGERTNIQDGSVLHVTHKTASNSNGFPLIIGDDVTVGHSVILHGCTIAASSLIGMGSKILDGAIVHSHVVVGAGSLVPPGVELESGYLWLGAPVRKKRALTDEEMQFFAYSARHYVQLKDSYL